MKNKDELFTTLLDAASVRIERIVSHGHASPEGFWYDHDQAEFVITYRIYYRQYFIEKQAYNRFLVIGRNHNIDAFHSFLWLGAKTHRRFTI